CDQLLHQLDDGRADRVGQIFIGHFRLRWLGGDPQRGRGGRGRQVPGHRRAGAGMITVYACLILVGIVLLALVIAWADRDL
ncbi:hypothetical protein ABTM62_20230, partial [Acinetobacter baumannii]